MKFNPKTCELNEETYVCLDDVLKFISGMKLRIAMKKDKDFKKRTEKEWSSACLALVKLQLALIGQDDEQENMPELPARYAVGRCYDEKNNYYMFYAGEKDNKPIFSNRPCVAKAYNRRRQAEAVAEFLDDGDWEVFDMWDAMTPQNKSIRKAFAEKEDDEGNDPITRLSFKDDDVG